MNKSNLQLPPSYFDRYIQLVDDVDLDVAFESSLQQLRDFDWATCEKIGLNTYAPGKWSIPDILQHLLDWERIMTYRALVFARTAAPTVPGHDEDQIAVEARANRRSVAELVQEMTDLRATTRTFFRSLDAQHLQQRGISFNSELSPLAYGYIISGHQRHHLNIIVERYFPTFSL
jgi:hypothetical protein